MSYKAISKLLSLYLTIFLIVIIIAIYLLNLINETYFQTFIYAICIAFTNFIIGYFSIKKGLKRDDKRFLLIVFGAMITRFFVVFLLIISVLSFLDVKTDYFIFTTFIMYFYYLIIEILYLNKLNEVEEI